MFHWHAILFSSFLKLNKQLTTRGAEILVVFTPFWQAYLDYYFLPFHWIYFHIYERLYGIFILHATEYRV